MFAAAPFDRSNQALPGTFCAVPLYVLTGNLHQAKTNFELALGLNSNYEKAKSWQRKVSQSLEVTLCWTSTFLRQKSERKAGAGALGLCLAVELILQLEAPFRLHEESRLVPNKLPVDETKR